MKPSRLLIATIVAAAASTAFAQSGLNDPMTKAMMDVYNQELQSNPDNYEIYFRRANEYYKFNQYLRALSDIDNAILHAPKSDADMLFQCHLLRGEIYQMLEKPAEALSDFTKALSFDPTSFMALYQKANCEYELGKYAEAKADYNRLRANNGRSAEALTGLARVAIKENNLGLASEYMDDAVAMMPADSDIYVRRSGIRRQLGNNTGAVDDLLMAISTDNNPKAFQQLIDMASADYPAVITALSNAIHQAPDQGMFPYMRAVIAQAHQHYPQAIADYNKIIDANLYNYAGIYNSLAECYLALCDVPQALDNVNRAIGMGDEKGEYLLTAAKIYRAQKRFDDALSSVEKAMAKSADPQEALLQKALILNDLGRGQEASDLLGEMIIDHPHNASLYLFRGAIVDKTLDKHADALSIYRRMAALGSTDSDLASLHGFALLASGDKEGAVKWADSIRNKANDSDGCASYTLGCLYAQAGELTKSAECIENALGKGYANRFNLTVNSDGMLNPKPLRADGKMDKIITSYSYIFEQ